MRRTVILLALVFLAALATPAHAGVVLDDNFDDTGYTLGQDWQEGSTYGLWTDVWNGFGTVEVVNASNFRLRMTTADADVTGMGTHGALVRTTATYSGDIHVEYRGRMVTQLRDTPNPWEGVPWMYFHAGFDSDGEWQGNYIALKPNGLELGQSRDGYTGRQRFLVTLPAPTLGTTYKVIEVQQVGQTLRVWVNGSEVDLNGAAAGRSWTDPLGQLFTSGSVAPYVEDGSADVDDVLVSTP